MAVVYQVRYPSVSGTGADWRNLELSPLPLSNDRYILNERRYHQPRELRHWAIIKSTKLHIYPKLNHSNLICGLNLKWILYLFKATPSAQFWRNGAHKQASPSVLNIYIARQGGTHTLFNRYNKYQVFFELAMWISWWKEWVSVSQRRSDNIK